MAVHNARLGRPARQVSKANTVPAPFMGIDARTVLASGDPNHCIYAFNFLPGEYGLRVRPGYREWQIELEGAGVPLGVRTIIPFGGNDDDEADDRLFAVTNEGIWDVTVEAASPSLVVDFSDPGNGGDTSTLAGWGVYDQMTTDAGDKLILYADSINGLFQYDATTDTWSRPSVTGPTIENINFVTVHKNQIWAIERDESFAWYLPAGSVSGMATEFYFGINFKHGGNLAGLFTWTIDGGEGVDDYFIAVSRAGDVLPYKGTDPSSADTWGLTGHYFIGAVPTGNRFAATQEGNLYLLSVYGLISMDDLIRGVDGKNINAQTNTIKIAPVIRRHMEDYRNERGWEVNSIPGQGNIIIGTPKNINDVYLQYAMNTTTEGWGIWRDVPIQCFAEWAGKMYFGTEDSRVMVMDVTVDNALITPESETNGDAISFSILTTYQNYGEPALMKRGKYIRPQFVSTSRPNVTVQFRYDYDLAEVLNTESTGLTSDSLWDIGLWDVAIWTSGALSGFHRIRGGWGIGRNVAIAMSGNTRFPTTLVSWDVVWDTGAPL